MLLEWREGHGSGRASRERELGPAAKVEAGLTVAVGVARGDVLGAID